MVVVAFAKLREPKHVRTRGTDSKLESDERKARDEIEHNSSAVSVYKQTAWQI